MMLDNLFLLDWGMSILLARLGPLADICWECRAAIARRQHACQDSLCNVLVGSSHERNVPTRK